MARAFFATKYGEVKPSVSEAYFRLLTPVTIFDFLINMADSHLNCQHH